MFVPVRVEVESDCASAAPVVGVTPGSPPVATGPSSVEAKGAVTAVRAGEFDLSIFKIEYAAASLTSVTVRHSSATYFDRLTPAMLAVGSFVEVKGTLSGTTLEANKIEFD